MATSIDGLNLRRVFGRKDWMVPEQFGPDGWRMIRWDLSASVIATCFDWDDGLDYLHASISRREVMPSYEDLVLLREAVFGDGYAYQQFVPASTHISIHDHALHLWGRADGKPILPDFGEKFGSI